MKQRLLDLIDQKIDALNSRDVTGHVYWNLFRELVESVDEHSLYDYE